ncbi:MAG: hypothetical protein COA78_12840 [Blastopirellula sp.]|nr:MAG: hypothetical protein COA78_12840 [Blastopirellula sp.]
MGLIHRRPFVQKQPERGQSFKKEPFLTKIPIFLIIRLGNHSNLNDYLEYAVCSGWFFQLLAIKGFRNFKRRQDKLDTLFSLAYHQ